MKLVLGKPMCEFADVVGDMLQVSVWLGAAMQTHDEYELHVIALGGKTVTEVTAKTQFRRNTSGVPEKRWLRFELPIHSLPNGQFRLRVVSPSDGFAKDLQPTSGLLACSRPRAMGDRRYQFFPNARFEFSRRSASVVPRAVLRIASNDRWGRFKWNLRNVMLDFAYMAFLKRFSFTRFKRIVTKPFMGKQPIWLVGERHETARDNGIRFFEYLRAEHPELRAYYIIDEDSPMIDKVTPLGNVVFHSSWRHRILMLHASVLANAYSIKHMVPKQWHPSAYTNLFNWRVGSRRVYLKHGVHDKTTTFKRGTNGYDLVVTVGPGESGALMGESGYTDQQIKEVGLPRYDTLVRTPGRKTILMMLTWRRYFVPKLFSSEEAAEGSFEGSKYQEFVNGLLGSERLSELLRDQDVELVMIPHYNMAKEIETIQANDPRITILDGATADIPELLKSCDLLLTDYSSVHFDVGYLNTPVVYAQFDREEFQQGHATETWFHYKTDGFGPVVETLDATIDELERYAVQNFASDQLYTDRVEAIFTHQDQNNRERLYSEILQLELDADPVK